MHATYSFQEIKALIRTLDFASLAILKEVVEEEKECFSEYELKALNKFLQLQNKAMVRNEVKADFLLAYN